MRDEAMLTVSPIEISPVKIEAASSASSAPWGPRSTITTSTTVAPTTATALASVSQSTLPGSWRVT
jgi:hypothetical protein